MHRSRVASLAWAPWVALAALCSCTATPRATGPPERAANILAELRRAIPPDAPRRTVDTVEALLSLREGDAAAHYVVRGCRQAGDDGGGVFRYDEESAAEADGGTVLAPKHVPANRNFYESADHVVVRDLAVDCNFDGQNKHTTINAIGLRGGGALVERCNFRGYGTGCHPSGHSRECFVIHQGLVYKHATGCRQAAVYRDLDFTDPGHNGSVAGHVAEITHITLGGAHNFENYSWIVPKGHDPDFDPANGGENENNWWPAYGGLVERCTIRDERYDPATQKSPLHGITYSDCIGVTIRNNTIRDFEGAAVFVMSWWNRGTTIVDNHFTRVSSGVALHVKGSKGKPLQCPRHDGVRIERNTIALGAPRHHRWSPIGIQLYGQDLDKAVRLKDILVRENRIEGRSYVDAAGKPRHPTGITIQLLRANHQNLVFEDNVIDVPHFGPGAWVPQEPHSQSIVYFPLARWADDAASGNVRFVNNRTPAGRRVHPILADWWFKNKPTYGR